ncbi:MAG: hypothetical protein DMD87_23225 [Candidatus Rokuibacteriota bacterium]|nr:MAG: hypothetical protein DMD87_23225 [Candidatus Rokubacteria bacterium]
MRTKASRLAICAIAFGLPATSPATESVCYGTSFMQGEPWIRHDEHYHVDFAVRASRAEA